MPGFRFHGTKIFLTYAQCPIQKEVLLKFFEALTRVESYTIGREKHVDGNFHLHAIFVLPDGIDTRDIHYFDVEGYHPNIKKCTNKTAYASFVRYCKKDGDFITNEKEALGVRAALFRELLEEGLTPSFVQRHPEIMQFNLSNLRAWLYLVSPPQVILAVLPKQRHIWLSGQKNTGKSTFLKTYALLFESVGQIPYNDDYQLVPYNCDLLFADEYRGQLTVQQLNRLCDGGSHVNTKGGSRIIGQPLIFICSNFTIDECYHNTQDDIRDTVRARFQQYVAPSYPRFPTREL